MDMVEQIIREYGFTGYHAIFLRWYAANYQHLDILDDRLIELAPLLVPLSSYPTMRYMWLDCAKALRRERALLARKAAL